MLERIIDVIKVSYRGTKSEAAYTLDDSSLDHGNFLEMIILLGKYDICMNEHLVDCIKKSQALHKSVSREGRGALITLLSKTTVNNVITTIHQTN